MVSFKKRMGIQISLSIIITVKLRREKEKSINQLLLTSTMFELNLATLTSLSNEVILYFSALYFIIINWILSIGNI